MTAIEYANNKEEIDDLEEINDEITMDEYKEQERQENSFECVKCGTFFTEESNAYQGFTCDSCLEDSEDSRYEQEVKEQHEEDLHTEKINYLNEFDNLIKNDTELESSLHSITNLLKCKVMENKIDGYSTLPFTNFITALENKYNEKLAKEYKKIILLESHKVELEYYFVRKTIDYIELTNTVNSGIDDFMLHQAKSAIDYIISKRQNYQANIEDLANGYVNVIELEKPVEQEKEQTETETSFKDLSAFSATWKTKHDFEQVLKSASVLVDEITFEVDGSGLTYRSMDASHVALIDVFLAKTCFESFDMPEKITKFGLRIDETLKILQQIENNESLEIRLNVIQYCLEISNKEGFKSKQRLIESSEQNCPLPKLTYNTEITLTEKAINILKKRSQLGEYFTIETKQNEYVNFIVRNDMGEFEQKFDCLSQVVAELKTKEDSVATYSVDYMMKFLKSFTSIKPKEFKFEYSSKMPLRIEVPEINGRMHFYLAPRIQD